MKAPKLFLGLLAGAVSLTAFSQDSTKTTMQQHDSTATTTQQATTTTQSHDSTAVQSNMNSNMNSNSNMNNGQVNGTTTTSTATPYNPLSHQWDWEKQHNGTATATDASAQANLIDTTSAASNFPKPNSGRHYIPVIGSYKSTDQAASIQQVTVTVDEQNPGKVWVEGLMPARFYAVLKAVPGTYKIPAQKADDKNIPEGTMMYDDNSKQLTACVGCGYNDATPMVGSESTTDATATDATASNATAKTKVKANKTKTKVKKQPVVTFTGIKDATASIQ
jgi:hypothetical protein